MNQSAHLQSCGLHFFPPSAGCPCAASIWRLSVGFACWQLAVLHFAAFARPPLGMLCAPPALSPAPATTQLLARVSPAAANIAKTSDLSRKLRPTNYPLLNEASGVSCGAVSAVAMLRIEAQQRDCIQSMVTKFSASNKPLLPNTQRPFQILSTQASFMSSNSQ